MNYTETHPWITFTLDLSVAPVKLWTLLGDANSKVRGYLWNSAYAGDRKQTESRLS